MITKWSSRSLLALAIILITTTAFAQGVATSVIEGIVKDESGAPLPGVTVTASSPALLVREVTTITKADGTFQLRDLPPGVYRIAYDLEGFQPYVREGVRLNVGFVAKLDAGLKVSTMKEAITVSGQSPVVDPKSTAAAVNFTKDTLENLPTTKSTWQILGLTPGVRIAEQDVGGSKMASQLDYKNYGTRAQNTPLLEGINTRQATDEASFYYDYSALQEAQVRAVGNDAEVALPGTNLVAIVKSGGNDFSGSAGYAGQWSGMQSNNVTDSLRARGVRSSDKQNSWKDAFVDLGGPIVRDKLWFYGALHDQRRSFFLLDMACSPGPDGKYLTADDNFNCPVSSLLQNQTGKLSYQATPKYRAVAFYERNKKFEPFREGGKFRPEEATNRNTFIPQAAKLELDGTPSSQLLVDALVGYLWYFSLRDTQSDTPGNPSRFFRDTGLFTGPNAQPTNRFRNRWQSTASTSWFPDQLFGGKHQFKAGVTWYLEQMGRDFISKRSGNYLLVYDNVNGVPGQPVEIQTFNYPIHAVGNRLRENSGYVKDSWTITPRLTANIGVRIEHYHSYINEQTKVQGQFGNSGTIPPQDVLKWTGVAPRVAFAYDIKGNGKSVAKLSYGRFNHTMGDLYGEDFNKNSLSRITYRWRDLDGNNDYTPGEVNLDPNGPDFLSVSGAANNIINKDLKQPYTNEVSFALEHEVMPNFGARFLYVFKQENRLFQFVNVLRPYSAYNIPLTRRDPGPDGILGTADDGPPVTIYDYDPAYRGSKFVGNMHQNAKDPDYYHNYELTLNKRYSRNWEMLSSFGATKNHRQLVLIPQSPNDQYNRIDATWEWQIKVQGIYRFPHGFHLSTLYQHLSGIPLQRTYIFRATDPAGGPPLKQLGSVKLRMERFGARRTPQEKLLSFRLAKEFSLGAGRSIEINADLFNALNTNVPVDMVVDSGPSFNAITAIIPPRIGRVGALFRF
jgi:hypothetical protein